MHKQPHKPHKNNTAHQKTYEKNNQSTWVPHVSPQAEKRNWHYKSSSFRGEDGIEGKKKTPEDGCMKPKHVVWEEEENKYSCI
jgi:hypothetical protein